VLFRLDNAPRSIPVLHFLLLAGGLMFGRSLSRLREKRRDARLWPDGEVEHILIVGSSRLASFYVRMLDELAPATHRPLAIFDDKPSMRGRSIAGCPIVGAVADLPRMIDEYDVHGIKIHRVVIAKPLASLSAQARLVLDQLAASNIVIQPLDSQLFVERSRAKAQVTFAETPELKAERRDIVRRPYWLFKRAADIALSGTLLILMAPIACGVALIAFYDVGHPVVFWQRRVGRFGSPILVSKFRTLRAPFDTRGRPWSDEQRLTPVGKFLRATRCDEIPQLISVLSGEMSIIGPRPLLPHDQPDEIGLRLMVAPGLTGWAQVNGGKTVTIAEKDAMDEYYVRHASVWLDLWILVRTPWMMVVGDRRGERAIARALEDALRHRVSGVAGTSEQSGLSDAAE
jgi:lipopolysaccharide/colanic/teichoic acid biosynthesis glycosyltransferase